MRKNEGYYSCSGGCRNCPRLRACKQAAAEMERRAAKKVPQTAVQPVAEMAVQPPVAIGAVPIQPMPQTQMPAPTPTVPTSPSTIGGAGVGESPVEEGIPENPNESFQQFLLENPEFGSLRIQAFRGEQVAPIPGVTVKVTNEFNGQPYLFFEGVTNESGIIDGIILPAPTREQSLRADVQHPSATYMLLAEHPNFLPMQKTVDIYQGVKPLQPLQLRLRMR